MSVLDELRQLVDLVEIEKQEDYLQFREMVLQTPLEERKQQGISWHPVAIVEEEVGLGGKLNIVIQRMANRDEPHSFSTGSIISLFADIEGRNRPPFISGVVSKVQDNRLVVSLYESELPEWTETCTMGLDLAHDEKTFIEMRKALQSVINATNNRTEELRDILLGKYPARFSGKPAYCDYKFLNESQQRALEKVAEARDVAIIHGPPGTGKTTTLVAAIEMVLQEESQVLVCAPSNTSVDLLALKLLEKEVKVLRLGHPARTHKKLHMHTIDMKITQHRLYKQWKQLRKQAQELRAQALKFKRHFDASKRQQRQDELAEARQMFKDADKLEKHIFEDILNETQAIVCTLTGASYDIFRKKRFSTVFIDEAAQGMEPACWIPILLGDRVIFAGDHCQLPPTIKSRKAAQEGLAITLMEKCIQRQQADVMLSTQYRMHQDIMEFSNRWFYQNQLVAHETVAEQTLEEDHQVVEFIDTAGCGLEELLNEKTMSLSNDGEAELLVKHLLQFTSQILPETSITIAVIAPYKEQVYAIKEKLKPHEFPKNIKISVNTVDGFQGQERDVIYISLVRSNSKGEIGFLSDIRRMNVAMTRAKKKLVVIGDTATLAGHEFYHSFFEYVEEINAYKTAWELS